MVSMETNRKIQKVFPFNRELNYLRMNYRFEKIALFQEFRVASHL